MVFSDAGPYVVVIMTDLSANLDGLVPYVELLDAVHTTMRSADSAAEATAEPAAR